MQPRIQNEAQKAAPAQHHSCLTKAVRNAPVPQKKRQIRGDRHLNRVRLVSCRLPLNRRRWTINYRRLTANKRQLRATASVNYPPSIHRSPAACPNKNLVNLVNLSFL